MSAANISSGCGFMQSKVAQTPRFEGKRKRKWSSNQAMSKSGVIRGDKRKKLKYL